MIPKENFKDYLRAKLNENIAEREPTLTSGDGPVFRNRDPGHFLSPTGIGPSAPQGVYHPQILETLEHFCTMNSALCSLIPGGIDTILNHPYFWHWFKQFLNSQPHGDEGLNIEDAMRNFSTRFWYWMFNDNAWIWLSNYPYGFPPGVFPPDW